MEVGIDTTFSSDDTFFEEAMKQNKNQKVEKTNRKSNHDVNYNPMFDPPSKICGGAVFSKLMSISGSRKNSAKGSPDNNTEERKKKTKKHQSQQLQLLYQLETEETSSKLMAKLTNKIMKRKKDMSTEDPKYTPRNFKPTILMPSSTDMSPLTDPCDFTSPWVTDDIPLQQTENNGRFYGSGETTNPKPVVVMGESTGIYANNAQQQHPRNENNSSLQNLQSILSTMKDLNGMVKENSVVLEAGIENISNQIQYRNNKVGQLPKNERQSNDPLCFGDDKHRNQYHITNTSGEETCDANKNNQGGEKNESTILDQKNEIDEIEKLKMERNNYRSEAEILRLEMEGIKEQLSEIRKFLPQLTRNNETDLPKQSSKEKNVYQQPEGNQVEVDIPHQAYISSSSSSTASSSTISSITRPDSRHRCLETIDNPYMSDTREASFRNEISNILSEQNARPVLGRNLLVPNKKEATPQQQSTQSSSTSSIEREKNKIMDNKPPQSTQSSESDPPSDRSTRRFRGRSLSPLKRRNKINKNVNCYSKGISDEVDLAEAKSFYKKQWEKSKNITQNLVISSTTSTSSSLSASTTTSTSTSTTNLLAAEREYRQLLRSLRQDASKRESPETDNNCSIGNINNSNTNIDSSETVQLNPRVERPDDEYMDGLRSSWYKKQGLVESDASKRTRKSMLSTLSSIP